jgi:hypothetical protein
MTQTMAYNPLRLVLCCMAAASIALVFLGCEQRSVLSWASKNARSASVSWTDESTSTLTSNAHYPDTSPTVTATSSTKEQHEDPADEEPKEQEPKEQEPREEPKDKEPEEEEPKEEDPEEEGPEEEEPEEDRPPLDALIGDLAKNIQRDVEFLLDFAIIGHPKTATSSTMFWLAKHPEIQMYKHELGSLYHGKPAELVSQLYALPPGRKYKRGYKAPNDIRSIKALDAIAEYWPNCKLIVGLRHPVTWFQSFYNFRVQFNYTMPPAGSLIGKCSPKSNDVCTDNARFHLHLNLLGKTNQTTLEEKKLLVPLAAAVPKLAPLHNQVFLYEMRQLGDEDEARSYKYRRDLGNFLGLEHELKPIVHKTHTNAVPASTTNSAKPVHLDICEDRYRPLRQALMEAAKSASEWIRTYFMQSPEVVISSPEFFNELLLEWMEDPCDEQ